MRYRRFSNRYYRPMRKRAGIAEHLVLPGAGAGVAGLLTLLNVAKTKGSIKEKLKRLIRNAALGGMVGGGLELGRMGATGLYDAIKGDKPIDGDPTADGHFLRYE